MQIKCPICGEICESDVMPDIGQHVLCPFCSKKFSYSGTKNVSKRIATKTDGGVKSHVAKKDRRVWTVLLPLVVSFLGFVIIIGVCYFARGGASGGYDDSVCCLEVQAAILENDFDKAIKWANRISDEHARRLLISNIKMGEKIGQKTKGAMEALCSGEESSSDSDSISEATIKRLGSD